LPGEPSDVFICEDGSRRCEHARRRNFRGDEFQPCPGASFLAKSVRDFRLSPRKRPVSCVVKFLVLTVKPAWNARMILCIDFSNAAAGAPAGELRGFKNPYDWRFDSSCPRLAAKSQHVGVIVLARRARQRIMRQEQRGMADFQPWLAAIETPSPCRTPGCRRRIFPPPQRAPNTAARPKSRIVHRFFRHRANVIDSKPALQGDFVMFSFRKFGVGQRPTQSRLGGESDTRVTPRF